MSPFGPDLDRSLLVVVTDDPHAGGWSLSGRCGHCGVTVDNHDPNHRVSAILRGGRGVECVLRGDIHPSQGAPLGPAKTKGLPSSSSALD